MIATQPVPPSPSALITALTSPSLGSTDSNAASTLATIAFRSGDAIPPAAQSALPDSRAPLFIVIGISTSVLAGLLAVAAIFVLQGRRQRAQSSIGSRSPPPYAKSDAASTTWPSTRYTWPVQPAWTIRSSQVVDLPGSPCTSALPPVTTSRPAFASPTRASDVGPLSERSVTCGSSSG